MDYKVAIKSADGRVDEISVPEGESVMRAALDANITGIIGECGGQAMCATCHVYVSDADALPQISDDEDEMLDCTTSPRETTSRLSCQLKMGQPTKRLAVELPESQF